MKIKTITVVFCSFFICAFIHGQKVDTIEFKIDEVVVQGVKHKYSPGTKIGRLNSAQLIYENSKNLGQTLQKLTPIYVKSYAGGLSTISFRGTSPDHTAIYYDGINLNSLTLGHSNLFNIPTFFFDQVEIQYGGASSLYGSDAIGGTIHLNSTPSWKKGISGLIQQDIASFHTSFTGAKIKIGNKKIESSTKILFKSSKNDFPFLNIDVKNFETGKFRKDRQKNSNYQKYGVLQEIFYRINGFNTLFIKYFNIYNWHAIQPKMSTNFNGGDFNEIKNNYQILIAGYSSQVSENNTIKLRTAYINDFQLYNLTDTIATKRLNTKLEHEHHFKFEGSLNTGIQYKYVVPMVHAYDANIREQNLDIFTSYMQKLSENTEVALSIRSVYIDKLKSNLLPSLSISHLLYSKHASSFKLSASLSKSFNAPTFNDRYWKRLGNPDLKPEFGTNSEISIIYMYKKYKNSLKLEVNAYSMMVDNWISWIQVDDSLANTTKYNINDWIPINEKKVHSRGLEIMMLARKSFTNNSHTSIMLNYSFNASEPIEIYPSKQHELHTQLPYSPRHSGLVAIDFTKKPWNINIITNYTGTRKNNDQKINLDPYMLLNGYINRDFTFKEKKINITMHVNNILNKNYINIEHYAMPGINWQLSIKYSFQSTKN